jgi:hypothetical protein
MDGILVLTTSAGEETAKDTNNNTHMKEFDWKLVERAC